MLQGAIVAKLGAAAKAQAIIDTGCTIEEACRRVGIPERTYYRWRADGVPTQKASGRNQESRNPLRAHVARLTRNLGKERRENHRLRAKLARITRIADLVSR